MAAATVPILSDHFQRGVLSVPIGSNPELIQQLRGQNLDVREGAENNLPDAAAQETALKIKNLVTQLKPEDLLIVLVSGGGSALLPLPKEDVTLEDKLDTIRKLTQAGATISELNVVRTNLSALKGGRLAALSGSNNVLSLILSDIIGDPVHLIASGPTVPPLPCSALEVVSKYGLLDTLSEKILKCIKEEDKLIFSIDKKIHNLVIGNNLKALEAAASKAEELGFASVILTDSLSGEVRKICSFYEQLCQVWSVLTDVDKLLNSSQFPSFHVNCDSIEDARCMIYISGGEPTVSLHGKGKGGRNQELALRVAKILPMGCVFLSAGTDGIDGPTDVAGAVCDPSSVLPSLDSYLEINDSHSYLELKLEKRDFIFTGHTGTNVMDIHLLFVQK
ncbi:glycerate kinase isoform X2 [Neocloeon triangulifer]|nr:glycerate kinase isoform X2 [Neocloeon triangulifer]